MKHVPTLLLFAFPAISIAQTEAIPVASSNFTDLPLS